MVRALWVALIGAAIATSAGRAEEGTVTAADGTAIAYEIQGAGAPALVFIHGWAGNRSSWTEQVPAFAANHVTVAVDLPGHGVAGRDRESWTVEAYGDDVARVVEALDLDPVVLVGHSMGGTVALLAAARLGDRVAGIVCADTLHDAEFKFPEEAMQGWLHSFEQDYEAGMRQGIATMVVDNPALGERIVAEAMKADHDAMLALIPRFGAFDLAAALSAVDVPVRCINAAPYGPYALPTAIEMNRKYADFDVVLMDGVGHFLHLERPDEFNAHMRDWLEQMPAAAQ